MILYILCFIVLLNVVFSVVMYCELDEAREIIRANRLPKEPIINNEVESFRIQAELLKSKLDIAKELGLDYHQINKPMELKIKSNSPR